MGYQRRVHGQFINIYHILSTFSFVTSPSSFLFLVGCSCSTTLSNISSKSSRHIRTLFSFVCIMCIFMCLLALLLLIDLKQILHDTSLCFPIIVFFTFISLFSLCRVFFSLL